MDRTRLDATLMIGGGVGLIAGSFLAWAVLLGQHVSGMDGGDGRMTVAGSVVLVAFGIRLLLGDTNLPLWFAWAGILVAIGVAGINLLDIMSTGGDDVSIGIGMKLMVLSGFIGFVGLVDYTRRISSRTK